MHVLDPLAVIVKVTFVFMQAAVNQTIAHFFFDNGGPRALDPPRCAIRGHSPRPTNIFFQDHILAFAPGAGDMRYPRLFSFV